MRGSTSCNGTAAETVAWQAQGRYALYAMVIFPAKIGPGRRLDFDGPAEDIVGPAATGSDWGCDGLFERDSLEVVRSIPSRGKVGSPAATHPRDAVEQAPDSFVLYRIIGNDLEPRHRKGQSRENLRFILENEASFAQCEKRWVVNRIVDQREEEQILALLEAHGQEYIFIPFSPGDYREVGWDFDALPKGFLTSREFAERNSITQGRAYCALARRKNNYIMNNNGARNAALAEGRKRANWVLPWDGNCFLTKSAWTEIVSAVVSNADLKYFAVPMHRLVENGECLRDDFQPLPEDEPQLIFRNDAEEMFNSEFAWGRRPKVELFWRIGLPGPWDDWTDDPWDQPRREKSPEAAQFGFAGWVARLFSGMEALEESGPDGMTKRGEARRAAVISTVFETNRRYFGIPVDSNGLAFYSTAALDEARRSLAGGHSDLRAIAHGVIADAELALGGGPYSVTDKSTVAPSGFSHDYYTVAPYWWPDPEKPDGLPYIQRDGLRAPGTVLFSPDSGLYDRTRLQLTMDGTTSLALAWYLTRRDDFAEHGARLVRSWFLDPSTRMNPHLRYAQVRLGHDGGGGRHQGIIELKDLYYFLDAVRLLEHSGALTETDRARLRDWFSRYLSWLESSAFGKDESLMTNNRLFLRRDEIA